MKKRGKRGLFQKNFRCAANRARQRKEKGKQGEKENTGGKKCKKE